MIKNPYIRALLATTYIACVAMLMTYGEKLMGHHEDTLFAPIAFISLFTFSAAVMGYLFVFEPFLLYQSGEKKEAVQSFFKTLVTFGCVTFVIVTLAFSGVI